MTDAYNPSHCRFPSFLPAFRSYVLSPGLPLPSLPVGNSLFLSELLGHSFPHPSAVNGLVRFGDGGTSLNTPSPPPQPQPHPKHPHLEKTRGHVNDPGLNQCVRQHDDVINGGGRGWGGAVFKKEAGAGLSRAAGTTYAVTALSKRHKRQKKGQQKITTALFHPGGIPPKDNQRHRLS